MGRQPVRHHSKPNRDTLRTIITAILLSSTPFLWGQAPAEQPPASVKAHLLQLYPKASVKKWKQGPRLNKAEFVLRGEKYTAVYTTEGSWVRTEHDIARSQLPKAVHMSLLSGKYGHWKVTDMEEHTTPEHAHLFKVNVESDTEKAKLYFLPDGNLLNEEVMPRRSKQK